MHSVLKVYLHSVLKVYLTCDSEQHDDLKESVTQCVSAMMRAVLENTHEYMRFSTSSRVCTIYSINFTLVVFIYLSFFMSTHWVCLQLDSPLLPIESCKSQVREHHLDLTTPKT